jgi:hypothetical protein
LAICFKGKHHWPPINPSGGVGRVRSSLFLSPTNLPPALLSFAPNQSSFQENQGRQISSIWTTHRPLHENQLNTKRMLSQFFLFFICCQSCINEASLSPSLSLIAYNLTRSRQRSEGNGDGSSFLTAARCCLRLEHRLRKREDWTRNFRSVILRPILAQFTTMTVVHFPGT